VATDESTVAEGAIDATPVDHPRDEATPAQDAEIRKLLGVVAADWPDDERADALAAALADPGGALVSFRELAAAHNARRDIDVGAPDPGMSPCMACANQSSGGRRQAAVRDEL